MQRGHKTCLDGSDTFLEIFFLLVTITVSNAITIYTLIKIGSGLRLGALTQVSMSSPEASLVVNIKPVEVSVSFDSISLELGIESLDNTGVLIPAETPSCWVITGFDKGLGLNTKSCELSKQDTSKVTSMHVRDEEQEKDDLGNVFEQHL